MTTPDQVAELVTDDALDALRARPEFRAACEQAAANSVAHYLASPPKYRWVTKDRGRISVLGTALLLHSLGRLNVRVLTSMCVGSGIASPGRVKQVVRRCLDIGEMTLQPSADRWTRQPLRLNEGLIDHFRTRSLVDLQAALRLYPAETDLTATLGANASYMSYVLAAATVFNFGSPITYAPMEFFATREAGMLILFELLGQQPAQRARLLEAAVVDRGGLARAYQVSRPHVVRLFLESPDAELDGAQVTFGPALSDALERHFAITFQLAIGIARLARDGGQNA